MRKNSRGMAGITLIYSIALEKRRFILKDILQFV